MHMRRLGILLICSLLLLVIVPVNAQGAGNFVVECDTGGSFTNGVEVVVNQMRSGFSYTATAIGLNGFDPVLAVLDSNRQGLCNDDSDDAIDMAADLPTTGRVAGNSRSAQVVFSQNAGAMEDVSLVVGGYNDQPGEFLLILEGMATTTADGVGDPFSVRLSDALVNSGVPLSVYMIGVPNGVDPFMFLADENNLAAVDGNGNAVECDDAGTGSCWSDVESLAGSFVTRTNNRVTNADNLDAVISFGLDGYGDLDFDEGWFLTYVMTRATNGTGDYVVAIHGGVGGEGGAAVSTPEPTPEPTTSSGGGKGDLGNNTGSADLRGGVSVTCDDGTSFDNGVEFVVNQMRPGFSYTATAIGLNGFDPVLAVLDANGRGLCNDDSADAVAYFADLPSSGRVAADGRSAQVVFSQTTGEMADVSLVVGGFNNAEGQFILILEGMATTTADGYGDPFSVRITPGLVGGSVPLSVYMLGVANGVDPLLYLAAQDYSIFVAEDGSEVYCDDAGNESICWGASESLAGSRVARSNGRSVDGEATDPMMSIDMSEFADIDFEGEPLYLTFVMTRYEGSATGDYVVAFHAETR